MSITVLVPTYRRPKDLRRCLEALQKQTRPADEVLVVVRDSDEETWTLLKSLHLNSLPLRTATVNIPGQVAALNTGLDAAQGDIIAITDDDAAPHTDWLERIEAHFLSDSRIGGVGGRDWVYHGTELEEGIREVVGRVQWFGRTIGDHHLGVGGPREVEIFKGANMSFRGTALANLRFDERLRGIGAQAHNDLGFCLAVKRAGWTLIYDPQVGIDHFPAQRFDEDQRYKFNEVALINAVHNETLILLEYLSSLPRVIFLFWAILVGTRSTPGFIQWLRFLPGEGAWAGQKFLAVLRGRWQGWQTWRQQSALALDTFSRSDTPVGVK